MKSREHVVTNGRAVFYAAMWNDFRQAALNKGWSLGLHGSLANDMDIMAMPWTKDAVSPSEMILAIKNCFSKPNEINSEITEMPNNRIVYTLSIWADFYLDINIINDISNINQQCELTCMCKGTVQVSKINNKYICCTCNRPLM